MRFGSTVAFLSDSSAQVQPWDPNEKVQSGRELLAQPPETLVSAVLVAAARGRSSVAFAWSPHARIIATVTRKRLPFTEQDAEQLLSFARGARRETYAELLKTALNAIERAGPERFTRALVAETKRLERRWEELPSADAARLRARILSLVPDDATFSLPAEDDWAKRVRPQVRGAEALLQHFATATQSKPTQAWTRKATQLLEEREEFVQTLLEAAADAEVRLLHQTQYQGEIYRTYLYLAGPNANVVKGAVWAAGVLDAGWAAPLLTRIVRKAYTLNDGLANACILTLGELSDERAVRELATLQASIKHRAYQKRIVAALESAAGRAGLSSSQLLERLVPDFDLDAAGRKEIEVGRWHALVAAEPSGVTLGWRKGNGKEQRTVPSEVKERHATELKAVKDDVRELRKAVSVERTRIESLFAEEARWPSEDWQRYYLEHPLVSQFARQLIWVFDGVPALGRDAPAAAAEVELWHPIRAEPDEVARWRERLVEEEIRQPMKQAYREVYLLAPAEEETGVYSNRFAGHVLRYPQAYALFKERGWSGNALGPWDGGYEATIKREFRSHELRAEFYLQMVETGDVALLADLATTDQVRFYPSAGRDAEPVPLVDVPPLVFSEAMRDVDLFVGVSSIAADPTWLDRGAERFNEYWYETSFGELTGLATARRDALRELLPKLKIAGQCELDGRFLVVRGELGTYKIHIGSGNVLMEPRGQYLCIVPAPGKGEKLRGKVFLPFDDDPRLNVILSKAFLLADDKRIRDPSITAQLNR
jgi:hypothetical protein